MDKGGQRGGVLYSAKQGGQHEAGGRATTGNEGAALHAAKQGGNMKQEGGNEGQRRAGSILAKQGRPK